MRIELGVLMVATGVLAACSTPDSPDPLASTRTLGQIEESAGYTPIEIGPGAEARDINDPGVVVGVSFASGLARGFRYENGITTDLAPLPGDQQSEVNAINFTGHAVGASGGPGAFKATLWGPSGPVVMGQLFRGQVTIAEDLNDSGVVVGVGLDAAGFEYHAFSWTPRGGFLDLTPAGAQGSEAFGVNHKGEVVGTVTTATGLSAWMWRDYRNAESGFPLPGLTTGPALALGISERSVVTGVSDVFGIAEAATVWTGTTPADAGWAPLARGLGINVLGRIVGYQEGSLATLNGVPVTSYLGTTAILSLPAGGTEGRAQAVNRCGTAVGRAVVNGTLMAMLWTKACDI